MDQQNDRPGDDFLRNLVAAGQSEPLEGDSRQ